MDRLKSSSLTIPSTKNNFANSSTNTKFINPTNNKYDPLFKNSGNHISFQTSIKQKSATPKESNYTNNNNENITINNPNNPIFQNIITESNIKIKKNFNEREREKEKEKEKEDSVNRQSMKNINSMNI